MLNYVKNASKLKTSKERIFVTDTFVAMFGVPGSPTQVMSTLKRRESFSWFDGASGRLQQLRRKMRSNSVDGYEYSPPVSPTSKSGESYTHVTLYSLQGFIVDIISICRSSLNVHFFSTLNLQDKNYIATNF